MKQWECCFVAQPTDELIIQLEKHMARIQLAPDIEFKMDIDLKEIDAGTRDYDVQQYK